MITGPLYNWLKFVALVVLPALATLYVALAGLWDLPSPEAVGGTIMAVDTFLGVVLHISATSYNSSTAQGTLNVQDMGDRKMFNLELDGDPEQDLEGKDRVVFKVRKTEPEVTKRPPRAGKKRTRAK